MRLRSIVFSLALSGLVVSVANCGSESGGDQPFTPGNQDAGGGTSSSSGFIPSGADSGLNSAGCRKLTCADQGKDDKGVAKPPIECGPASDGCGGIIPDCGKCEAPEFCGGGGPSKCGGTGACVPKTCEQQGIECGAAGDGCGGQIQCGTCQSPMICGGGGPSKCGGGLVNEAGVPLYPDGGACLPRTAADCQPGECGRVADGCGGLIDCLAPNQCPGGTTCGGGGTPNFCGGNTCTPTTSCAAEGATCGFVSNGCGQVEDCGGSVCPTPGHVCGTAGPNKCGPGVGDAGGCTTGLCADRPTDCPGGTNTTTLSGIVYMPNGRLPVYNAVVYVPNSALAPVPEGAAPGVCETCGAQASGDPITSVHTNAFGEFTLPDVPYRAGGIPVVIQAGRWRKQITVVPNRCANKELNTRQNWPQPPTADNTTFGDTETPTNHIPKFAVTSGSADAMQCLLRKLGIADSEFRHIDNGGRVNLFSGGTPGDTSGTNRYRRGFIAAYTTTDTWTPGNNTTRNFPNQQYLFGSNNSTDTSKLDKYDAVVLTCEGRDSGDSAGNFSTVWAGYADEIKEYADHGGRIFASHWHHQWLEYGAAPWGGRNNAPPPPAVPIANINHESDPPSPIQGYINTTTDKGAALAAWLRNANLLSGSGSTTAGEFSISQAQRTIRSVDETRATKLVSLRNAQGEDTHVQYFDFNTPVDQTRQCGRFVNSDLHVSAGSGDRVDNGSDCNAGSGGTGFPCNCTADKEDMSDQEKVLMFMLFDLTSCIQPNIPPPITCQPKSCAEQTVQCGFTGDGCGNRLNCGPCQGNEVCRGAPARCEPASCTPLTTCPPFTCGPIPNGCGGVLTCPDCTTPGQVCGGGGPNQCGSNSCTPQTCQQQGIECGYAGDTCGNLITCPPCPPGETCGGGGTPNKCGVPACTPKACTAEQKCGFIADTCGGSVNCGTCPPNFSCVDNKCVPGSVN